MTKKNFTPTELITLHNTDFFKVKAAATQKIDALFADLRDSLKAEIEKNKITFPKEVDAKNGKIFRGENYLGLPYLVLDYPKHFSKESVFAFRTMFWWGNFFSFTLHLQGKALEEQRNILVRKIPLLKKKNIYICVNDNPWQYHYEEDNYLFIDNIPAARLKKIIEEKEFLKLSRKIMIKDHEMILTSAKESFLYFYP